jgi:hypothetical protein
MGVKAKGSLWDWGWFRVMRVICGVEVGRMRML